MTFAQKLRGTLTFMVESCSGTSQEKLDFRMLLPCSSFMVGEVSQGDQLTELLQSGQLTARVQRDLPDRGDPAEIEKTLGMICKRCRLTLVERIENAASLYGHSLKGHHVCLLIKFNVRFLTS